MRPGDLIDIWVVEKALGAGGMGSVYRCHNRSAKRILAAIKVLDPSLRRVAGAEERFVREAEILFTLDHPGIVRVRNIRIDSDPPYLEMEFVEGESLDKMLLRGPLSWPLGHEILKQLTDALAYLHARGVRHRDVKPANVLVRGDGRLCLVDFGLAMEADQSRLTESNTTFGTVSYAPPEWIDPDAMDPEKWDLYSVGVVAWEILRGQIAFPVSGKGSLRQQAMQVIIAKQNHPPLDPGLDYHDDVRALIRDLTAPDSSRRPPSMAEVRDRVRTLDPTQPSRPGTTLSPSITPLPAAESTLANRDTPQPMRSEWAKALEQTPVPAEPGRRRASEMRTLITGPPTTRNSWTALGAVGLVVIGLAILAVTVATGVIAPRPRLAPTRDVEVVVSGLATGTHVSVSLDGRPPRTRTSWVWRFGPQDPGPHVLKWAIGAGCDATACPGDACPAWCGVGEAALDVVAGEGTQSSPLGLTPPPSRTVRVSLPADRGDVGAFVRFGEQARTDPEGDAVFDGFAPGSWPVEVTLGTCSTEVRGCHPIGDCPPGCMSWTSDAVVPWGEGEWLIEAPVVVPVVSTTHAVAIGLPPQPAPVPGPTAPAEPAPPEPVVVIGAGAPVTVAAFAAWLGEHAEWQRDAAITAGLADDGYLPGWSGGFAPPGTDDQAVRDVSWYAASAYCKARGGLADLDAQPMAWEESGGQPYIEWRVTAGRAAWRSGDGQSSTKVRVKEANSFTGFRCAR